MDHGAGAGRGRDHRAADAISEGRNAISEGLRSKHIRGLHGWHWIVVGSTHRTNESVVVVGYLSEQYGMKDRWVEHIQSG